MFYLCGGYSDYFDRERLTPLKSVVAEVFSHHGHPICSVSLSGVAETWIFCDRIVTAVCVNYYEQVNWILNANSYNGSASMYHQVVAPRGYFPLKDII